MDKEAIKKIAEIIDLAYRQDPNEPDAGTIGFVEFWSNQAVAELEKLGYRKLPKDKPLLLSENPYPEHRVCADEEGVPQKYIGFEHDIYEAGKKAQREADIKHYED